MDSRHKAGYDGGEAGYDRGEAGYDGGEVGLLPPDTLCGFTPIRMIRRNNGFGWPGSTFG